MSLSGSDTVTLQIGDNWVFGALSGGCIPDIIGVENVLLLIGK